MNMRMRKAYQYCIYIAKNHYENFPVASKFLPKKFRYPIAAIYTFARTADDISDEGNLSCQQRLNKIKILRQQLIGIANQKPAANLMMLALQDTINTYNLPYQYFHDLLNAFTQDIFKISYNNFEDVLHYCKNSANSIGRLLLLLANQKTPFLFNYSDKLCTSLQLINFLQDMHTDLIQRNRCYIPMQDLKKFDLELIDIKQKRNSIQMQYLINLQIDRAHQLFHEGYPILYHFNGILGFEIKLMINAASRILSKLKKRSNPFERPTFNWGDLPYVFICSIFLTLKNRLSHYERSSIL